MPRPEENPARVEEPMYDVDEANEELQRETDESKTSDLVCGGDWAAI